MGAPPGEHMFRAFRFKVEKHRADGAGEVASACLRLALEQIETGAGQDGKEDFVILGDDSVTPQILTWQLLDALRRASEARPATDVFLLQTGSGLKQGETELFSPVANVQGPCRGLPAIAVPVQRLTALRHVLPDSDLPAREAIGEAIRRGSLAAMQSLRPCFYQWMAPPPARLRQTLAAPKRHKMAVCLSSYKRPQDLQRQLFCLLGQSYSRFHIFVAVKGMTRLTFERLVLPFFRDAMASGKVTVRFFPNKNQVSNIIDTVRGLDTGGYDLFVKVDDDEVYCPDYLKHIDLIHSMLPVGFSSYLHGIVPVMGMKEGFPLIGRMNYQTCGSSLVMARSVMARVMECEAAPSRVCELVPTVGWEFKSGRFGSCEDQLLRMIMQEHGVTNRHPYLQALGATDHMIVRQGNASVTRGNLLDDDFKALNQGIADEEHTRETVLDCTHPRWKGVVRCFKGRAMLYPFKYEADVLSLSPGELVLKWDNAQTESFRADEDGVYHYAAPR